MPAATTSGGEELEAETALLVRRSDLPVPRTHPARSFFGGLPKLPAEFDWPRAARWLRRRRKLAIQLADNHAGHPFGAQSRAG
jgi:hypothetical protein